MSGNLGLGASLDGLSHLEEVSVAASIFSKNSWDTVEEDEAYVLAKTQEGGEARLKVRILAQRGPGVCDIEAVSGKPGVLVGQICRLQVFVENKLVADQPFNQYLGPEHCLLVQFRIVGVQTASGGLGV
jgi:hypothetical protein